jgi:phosphoribosylamine--glycine ligase
LKVLILGSGAREHALAEAVAASGRKPQVFVAPGNDGMRDVATCVDLPLQDVDAQADWAVQNDIDLTIAGSEEPLVRGAWDAFDARRKRLFGPSAAAARLEGSKVFAKEFMHRHAIPTAAFTVCASREEAEAAVQRHGLPCVLKVDGLAAGKGVYVVRTPSECDQAFAELFVDARFGPAAARVLVEDCLEGPEASVFAICDGYSYRILGVAQDHKRAHDGNQGPNTGGMGAVSPVAFVSEAALQDIEQRILAPTLVGMLDEGVPYRGFLYLGLMMTPDGPALLEYNCRLGDPEAQVILPRLRSDFLQLVVAADAGDVRQASFELGEGTTVGVVLASGGYPAAAQVGQPVRGIEAARAQGARVFCAGVRRTNNEWRSSGGRILTIVAAGDNAEQARQRAYEAVHCIDIPGSFHRRDIGALDPEGEAWKSRSSAS